MSHAVFELLRQKVLWQTQDGDVILVRDMTPAHRDNTLNLLRRKASGLKTAYELRYYVSVDGPSGDAACDAFELAFDEVHEQDPQDWLAEFPLIQRLERLVARDKLIA